MSKYKYTDDYLRDMASKSTSCLDMMRRMGYSKVSGATQSHLKRRLLAAGVDISHWLRGSSGRVAHNRRTPSSTLVRADSTRVLRTATAVLRRALIAIGVKYCCAICGISDWCGRPLVLQVDHVDGDHKNNLADNLRFICPNCHTQTSNWGKRSLKVS